MATQGFEPDAHSLDFNFLTFKYDYIDLINTIKLILPSSIILLTSLIPCLKDRDFNVDFINDRILILNNVINEICIERKDCNYFNIHTMFINFILQGLSQQYYKYDGLHVIFRHNYGQQSSCHILQKSITRLLMTIFILKYENHKSMYFNFNIMTSTFTTTT